MDLFTDKANDIIKGLKPVNEKVIYDSSKDHKEEDDQQQPSTPPTPDEIKMGLTPQAMGAINVANKLAQNAKGGILFNRNPQKKMDQAYGNLLGKIAGRINTISKNL